jgi:hypothetical protein
MAVPEKDLNVFIGAKSLDDKTIKEQLLTTMLVKNRFGRRRHSRWYALKVYMAMYGLS